MKVLKFHIFLCILTFLFFDCTSKNNETIDSYLGFSIPKATLEKFVESKMKQDNIPGLVMTVINDGEIVQHFTKGYANLEKKIPVTSETIFEGASISKSIFAFFVMTFVEDGTIDLDKPLYEYLPYPDIAHDERYKKITARIVLSHRSGFPNWRTDYEHGKLFIQFEPDTDYLYSGEGYQYLAKVLRHLLKTDWQGLDDEFQKRIAIPLKMTHTSFIDSDSLVAKRSEPYDKNGKWVNWKTHPRYVNQKGMFVAPASILSEPLDFSKWVIALMDKKILTKKNYEELLKPHSNIEEASTVFYDINYTLGFYRPEIPLTNMYFGSGNNGGKFTAFFAFDPEKKWGYVLFCSSAYGEQLGLELLTYLLADVGKKKFFSLLIFSLILSSIAFVSLIKKIKRGVFKL